jgi:hypothetical protein
MNMSKKKLLRSPLYLSVFICVHLWLVLLTSCGSKPSDLRTVIPADALVYLETNDLGKALRAVTENEAFKAAAKTQPDFSALAGMKLAVAVTGFETKEQQVTEENSVLNFKPRFVAVAETNAWNYQALSFTENKLGEFINETYGGEVALETSDKHGGKYFVWAAQDGRKAYALVRGSLIFFGNDESAIEKCLAVTRGEAESITKNPKVAALSIDSLASGYVSTDGVAQISIIAGISMAKTSSEEGEVQSFIARILPEIVRNSVTEAIWTSKRSDDGRIEDNYTLSLNPDTAKVLDETVVPVGENDLDLSRYIPREFISTTRYNLKDSQIAWRSVLLTARSKTDQLSGNLLMAFSSSLFEAYAIEDPEQFLTAVASPLQTVRFDTDGEEVAVIARIKDLEKLKLSLAKELNLARPPAPMDRTKPPTQLEKFDTWYSDDRELVAAIVGNTVIVGEQSGVMRCLIAKTADVSTDSRFQVSNAAIVTFGGESDPEARLVAALADRKAEKSPLVETYTTETRFNQNGVERRTVSDFGLIGSIISQIDPEN